MALRDQIQNAIAPIFTDSGPLQDLAVEVTLSRVTRSNIGYDFATQTATGLDTAVSITIRGIVLSEEKRFPDGNRQVYQVLIRATDVPDINSYDSLTIGGSTEPEDSNYQFWAGEYRIADFTTDSFVHTIRLSGGIADG